MWHTVFITLHAAAGVIAFTAGCLALRRPAFLTGYLWSLVALVGFLAVVVALDWLVPATDARALFVAFLGLGGYMIWRAVQAYRLRLATDAVQRARLVGHIGFTLIALFDGFVVVLALDLGAPMWLIIVAAVAGIAVGHITVERIKNEGRSWAQVGGPGPGA